MNFFSKRIRQFAQRCGYALTRCQPENGLPLDFSSFQCDVVKRVQPFTKTTPERIHSLLEVVDYLEHSKIPGSFVECGVWRGGSMMAAAYALLEKNQTNRELWLYDTYTGMTAPSDEDVSRSGVKASSKFEKRATGDDSSTWCLADLKDVTTNMEQTKYPMERVHLVEGKVEETIPDQAPEQIALLRLDTDWYESTKHELEQLYPRIPKGGVVIIDDYGDWVGARKACDEYFAQLETPYFLHRIDDTARLLIKPN